MPSPQTATAIVIAAYNAEATLERAVTSALAQPEAAEICIVDDASTDGTAPLARALAARDARVSVHVLTLNGGPSVARNLAIASTSSPWLTILDADDYMADGRLAALHTLSGDADFVADRLVRTPLVKNRTGGAVSRMRKHCRSPVSCWATSAAPAHSIWAL